MTVNSFSINEMKRRAVRTPAPVFRLDRDEERRLIRAARAGDRRALGRLVTLLSGPVYRYGRSFCGDAQDAEDVSQAVFMALSRTLEQFRGDASLATWTYTVAKRACMRMRRTSRNVAGFESLEARMEAKGAEPRAGDGTDPARAAERAELRSALTRAIRALPRGQAEVVLLRDVEGLPARRVAKILGLSERAVKARLHRARVALRDALAPHVERPRAAKRKAKDDCACDEPAGTRRRCPDTTRLVSRYLEGDLDGAACDRLRAHVESCMDCGEACERLRAVLGSCRDFGRARLPDEVTERVRAALRDAVA